MNKILITLLNAAIVQSYNYRSTRISDDVKQQITEHIEELKGAVEYLEQGVNPLLATACQEADTVRVSERHERENEHLICALHDMGKELVRTTGEIRSLLLVLSKLDLGNTEKINMKVNELAGGLTEVKASALKGFSEVRNRIDVADARILVLEKGLADADLSPEAQAAFDDLKTVLKQLDDIVPDAPELPPVVNPPTPA